MSSVSRNPLRELAGLGQSVWLDFIRRTLLTGGELKRLIEEDALGGVTSNPAIFEKAIAGSHDYDDLLRAPGARELEPKALYERIAVRDIQDAADLLFPVWERTRARDGYVSLEVSPRLAADTAGTVEEARRLWKAVGRPNVMIKVPGTPQGVPAIRQLIADGINVNVTLLFSQEAYTAAARAYIEGVAARVAAGGDPATLASVASFFVSRIDSAVDALLAARIQAATDADARAEMQALQGRAAIANARVAYARYAELFAGPEWEALAAKGAQTQRLLWASTSTKNPAYRDVVYVEELIGADTVDTLPPATLEAFRDHGRARPSLGEDVDGARAALAALERHGVSMAAVTARVLDEGVRLFDEAFTKLLDAVAKAAAAPRVGRHSCALPSDLAAAVQGALAEWQAQDRGRRLWARDASLWSGGDEAAWLGWLGIVEDQRARIAHLAAVRDDVRAAGFRHALLLGMGGSSLCPEVLRMTFGVVPGHPELHVLDSTDPAQIRAVEARVDLSSTLFIVSSKSGGTLEPNIFKQYFLARAVDAVGASEAPRRFLAITDPGSHMQKVAEADGFRAVFFGWPSIGGRYSALSDFGMVPAAVMGLDVTRFLDRTADMVEACAAGVPASDNPGVVLGTVLGVAARSFGRDKLTLVASPGLHDLGAWLEQLVAESTGKEGKGIIPVDRERPGPPDVYGQDRVFAYMRLESAPDPEQDAAMAALEAAGHPVVRIAVGDVYDLGQELFRWEMATAVAGSILGINPFNQPDVEASKIATKKLTAAYEETGALPPEAPVVDADSLRLYTDEANAAALRPAAGGAGTLAGWLKAHLARLGPGDYFALLAYVNMDAASEAALQTIRHLVRDRRRVATCLGFGPRFLHSTGQAYKGGPGSGVFLQVTCDDDADLAVPGQRYTFGVVKAAQARGDFAVLAERGRRALRVHLGKDVAADLGRLESLVREALG